jgi:hypothetical protein
LPVAVAKLPRTRLLERENVLMLIGSETEAATWGWAAAAWPAACEIEAVRLSCDDADDEALVGEATALWATGADETEALELLALALDAGLVAALVIGLEATALWA